MSDPSADDLALLARHAPLLVLDRLERYAPVPVEPFLTASITADGGKRLSGPPADLGVGGCPPALHLDPAPDAHRAADRAAAVFARFAPAPEPAAWACYGRVLRRRRGRRLLQYWCGFPDNPFGLGMRDVGRHVGDWEQVCVELDRSCALAAVIVFQHGSPQRVAAGSPGLTLADGRPRVYVAEGSHAMYLTAGSQPRILKRDNTSEGRSGVPRVLPLRGGAGWATWCGRWGPDTGPDLPRAELALVRWIARRSIGGDSPWSPLGAHRGRGERKPSVVAGRAQPVNRLGRVLRWLGERTWPCAVALDGAPVVERENVAEGHGEAPLAGAAARERAAVRVRARSGGLLLRRARYLDATVVDAGGAAIGHARAAFHGRHAELAVPLLDRAGPPAEVRIAGYNRVDQRSDVIAAPL